MNLFQLGDFTLASGQTASWKIECAALTDADWECIAALVMKRYGYSEVHGVPTGGDKLASLLQKGARAGNNNSLIVDDVYTTGGSIRAVREKLIMRPDGGGRCYLGFVLFARMRLNPADNWVSPMFTRFP